MLIFPYRSDAPLYHLPVVTIGLIVLNVAAYAAMAMGELPSGGWLLTYGTGLHPQQWLLSSFMHGGVGHLLGNMIFLWIFGLVIEGPDWMVAIFALLFGPCHGGIGHRTNPHVPCYGRFLRRVGRDFRTHGDGLCVVADE